MSMDLLRTHFYIIIQLRGKQMNDIEKRPFTTIFILADENGEIYYSNINNANIAREFLEMANIKNNCGGCSAEKETYDYIITADRFSIEGKIFWAVTVEAEDSYKPYRDLSTELYNRNYWEHLKNGIIKLHSNMFYSLIVVDIDNLKECNDLYGHKAGDEAITAVGQAIRYSIRENDIPIHYGGDEYIIILPNTNIASAEKVIERIRNEIKNKYISKKLKIEISVGVDCSDDINELEQIMQSADEKMYMEKRKKKNENISENT